MRKWFCLALLLPLSYFGGNAQETRTLQPFDHIRVNGRIEVRLIPSDREELILDVRGTDEDDVNIYHDGSELNISLTKSLYRNDIFVEVDLYYKKLREIEGIAGAVIRGTAPIQSESIRLNVRSGSFVELDLDAEALKATAAEGGELRVSGKVDKQETNATTGGVVHGFDLASARTYVRASTGGQLYVQAQEFLDARASIGGHIEYRGNPAQKNTRSNLAGSIEGGS